MKKIIVLCLINSSLMSLYGVGGNELPYTNTPPSQVPTTPDPSLSYPPVSSSSSWWQQSLTYIIEHPTPFLALAGAIAYAYLRFKTNNESLQDDASKRHNEIEKTAELREYVTGMFEAFATITENNTETIENVSYNTSRLLDAVIAIADNQAITNERLNNLDHRDAEYEERLAEQDYAINLIRQADEAYRQYHSTDLAKNPIKYVRKRGERRRARATKHQKREELQDIPKRLSSSSQSHRATSVSAASQASLSADYLQPQLTPMNPRDRWQQSFRAVRSQLRNARTRDAPRLLEIEEHPPLSQNSSDLPPEKQEEQDDGEVSSDPGSEDKQIMADTLNTMRSLAQRSKAMQNEWTSNQESDT